MSVNWLVLEMSQHLFVQYTRSILALDKENNIRFNFHQIISFLEMRKLMWQRKKYSYFLSTAANFKNFIISYFCNVNNPRKIDRKRAGRESRENLNENLEPLHLAPMRFYHLPGFDLEAGFLNPHSLSLGRNREKERKEIEKRERIKMIEQYKL